MSRYTPPSAEALVPYLGPSHDWAAYVPVAGPAPPYDVRAAGAALVLQAAFHHDQLRPVQGVVPARPPFPPPGSDREAYRAYRHKRRRYEALLTAANYFLLPPLGTRSPTLLGNLFGKSARADRVEALTWALTVSRALEYQENRCAWRKASDDADEALLVALLAATDPLKLTRSVTPTDMRKLRRLKMLGWRPRKAAPLVLMSRNPAFYFEVPSEKAERLRLTKKRFGARGFSDEPRPRAQQFVIKKKRDGTTTVNTVEVPARRGGVEALDGYRPVLARGFVFLTLQQAARRMAMPPELTTLLKWHAMRVHDHRRLYGKSEGTAALLARFAREEVVVRELMRLRALLELYPREVGARPDDEAAAHRVVRAARHGRLSELETDGGGGKRPRLHRQTSEAVSRGSLVEEYRRSRHAVPPCVRLMLKEGPKHADRLVLRAVYARSGPDPCVFSTGDMEDLFREVTQSRYEREGRLGEMRSALADFQRSGESAYRTSCRGMCKRNKCAFKATDAQGNTYPRTVQCVRESRAGLLADVPGLVGALPREASGSLHTDGGRPRTPAGVQAAVFGATWT